MKAIAAWSAAHLAIRDPSFQTLALRHRGSAISNFKVDMQDVSISPEMCLAITMVLCSMETISEGTGAWYAHLKGGVAALRGLIQGPDSDARDIHPKNLRLLKSVDGRWLLRNLAYHDALSSVSLDRRPMLYGVYLNLDEDAAPDPYFGVAARVIQLLAQISELKADMVEASQQCAELSASFTNGGQRDFCEPHDTFSARAQFIEAQLRDWRYPPAFNGTALGHLGDSYRFGTLLHLYHALQTNLTPYSDVLRTKIHQAAQSTCDEIKAIPNDSFAECTLLFPLFMAGTAVVQPEQMAFVRRRLKRMNTLRGFCNVSACSVVLEEVWASVGSYVHTKNWLQVVKAKNWQIALT